MQTFASLGLAVLFLGASEARAGDPDIVPLDRSFHGMTYSEWGAEWWKWAYGAPVDSNPVLDTTGEFADVGQSGAVWFLAGSFGETLTRTVTVPSDKVLFFPIVNSVWPGPLTLRDGRYYVESNIDAVVEYGELSCEIDGVSVPDLESYRTSTVAATSTSSDFPQQSLRRGSGPRGPDCRRGYLLDAASALRRRAHDPHFASDGATFTVDVTYNLTVEET
jgi:hypothetical protein